MSGGLLARLAGTVAVLAAVAYGYAGMLFSRLPAVFCTADEDMGYAWFVPLFSLAVLWRERRAVARSAGLPSAWAFALAAPALLLGFLGCRGLQVRFELLGFIGLLIATPMAFFGRRTASKIFFPAACLLFCMPLASYLAPVTVHLRLFASAAASGLLSLFTDTVVREGNLISLTDVVVDGAPWTIDIANPCSGLRSIFAMLALSVAYGYFTLGSWAQRAALFACAVPIAVLGNVARIFSICAVAKLGSAGFATGFYHDFSGFIVFGVGIALLVAAASAVEKAAEALSRRRSGEGGEAPPPSAPESPPSRLRAVSAHAVAAVYAVAVVAAMWMQANVKAPLPADPPAVSLPELPGWKSEPVEPSVAETNILVGAKLEKKMYTRTASLYAPCVLAAVVTSGPAKESLHRPELCLPSQGGDMLETGRIRDANGIQWRTIQLGSKGGRIGGMFAYTFVNQDGYRTCSHEMRILRDVLDRSLAGKIDRWAMTTVYVPGAPDAQSIRSILTSIGKGGSE